MEASVAASLLCLLGLALSLLGFDVSLPRFFACYVCSVLDVASVGGRCSGICVAGSVGGGMCACLAGLITHPISLPRSGHLLT